MPRLPAGREGDQLMRGAIIAGGILGVLMVCVTPWLPPALLKGWCYLIAGAILAVPVFCMSFCWWRLGREEKEADDEGRD